ncbi:MAG: hypothetical protein KC466_19120 [Myxococcales bacterium]|nr:hypothetical protein [Myxococcales bacterium]
MIRRRRWTILVLLTGLVGCAGYRIVRDGAVNQALVDRLETSTEALRGLKFREPVGVRLYSKEQLVGFVEETLDQDYSAQDLEGIERGLVRMGLIGPETHYFDLLKATLRDNAAGFYDPEVKEFRLIEDFSPGFAGSSLVSGLSFIAQRDYVGELIVVHELTHALQDQHFDLRKTLPRDLPKTDEDAYAARKAIVESEANLVAYGHLYRVDLSETGRRGVLVEALGEGSGAAMDAVRAQTPGLPTFVVKELVFQYFGALPLLHRAMARGGWPGVDALYADPPASTELLLHVERYFAVHRDDPVAIGALRADADWLAGTKRLDSNVMGELGVRVMLEEFVDAASAADAAAGWGGDRFDILEFPGPEGAHTALLWRLAWDTAPDAEAFAGTYARALLAKYPGRLRPEGVTGSGIQAWRIDPNGDTSTAAPGVITRSEEVAAVEIRGTRVVVVEGVPPERWAAIVAGLWEGADPPH